MNAKKLFRAAAVVLASVFASLAFDSSPAAASDSKTQAEAGIDYDIVYVRAPRYGDEKNTLWPEIKDPIQMEPGTDLVLLHSDGSEEVLVKGGNGSVVDPYVSFDGESIYYSFFHDLRPEARNGQRRNASRAGADIYRIHVPTRETVRLTHQEWTPNTGVADWADSPISKDRSKTTLGYGIFNLGACPLPGGKVIFTSSRNGYQPNKGYTFPNLQLFVMDDDGRNVELVGHLNLGSALHPTVLLDGRVMFSSYESQGLRDQRLWSLWAIRPDGTNWEPLVSVMNGASGYHFQTQLSKGNLVVDRYYNQNNNGFGTLWSLPPKPTDSGAPPFGDPNPRHPSNPSIQSGWHSNGKPRMTSIPFSPQGLFALTKFANDNDQAAPFDADGERVGKVTHPSSAPDNGVLMVWSPGPANNLRRPTTIPYYDGGLYLLPEGKPIDSHRDLVKIKNDSAFNEMQPRPLVPFREIYGVDEPQALPWLPNDGTEHDELPAGTPFGLVGTSSFYKRNTTPGVGSKNFDGLDPFNTSQNGASSNWVTQGADAGMYTNDDIFAVRILTMEPSSDLSYGPNPAGPGRKNFINHANERLRILGEIPLRRGKIGKDGPILDPEGNPDTSFLAKIPADVPFTFQTLDKRGMVLNASQTWHQLRPGEVRYDCGGCHAHSQMGLKFEDTFAATDHYQIASLTQFPSFLSEGGEVLGTPGQLRVAYSMSPRGAIDVEFNRDIKPILDRSCVKCHSQDGNAEAGLVLDEGDREDGYSGTWRRLADDQRAEHGRKPVIRNGRWRQTNASRYVRKFQSRRSLLIWKIYGERLDGWTNEDHPTESVPGDPKTLPEGANPNDADLDYDGVPCPPPDSDVPLLSPDEKLAFARWIDLGCPISRNASEERGWFLDELRPTLTLSLPRAGRYPGSLDRIVIGMHDYYKGLDEESFSVTADFEIDGVAASENLASKFEPTHDGVWEWKPAKSLGDVVDGTLTVSVCDKQGNESKVVRTFSTGGGKLARSGR